MTLEFLKNALSEDDYVEVLEAIVEPARYADLDEELQVFVDRFEEERDE